MEANFQIINRNLSEIYRDKFSCLQIISNHDKFVRDNPSQAGASQVIINKKLKELESLKLKHYKVLAEALLAISRQYPDKTPEQALEYLNENIRAELVSPSQKIEAMIGGGKFTRHTWIRFGSLTKEDAVKILAAKL